MRKQGLAYPLEIQNGNLATSSGIEAKGAEVRSVLETRFYERVMRADYGTSDHTLDILDPYAIMAEFQNAVSSNVKGLTSLSVKGDWTAGDQGIFNVYVYYGYGKSEAGSERFSLAN